MFLRLFFILTLIPFVELWLLVKFTQRFDFGTTVLMIIGTGLLGAYLSKQQGAQALMEIRRQTSQGQMPTEALFDGMMIFVAGILLVTPGVLTDLLGLLLLIPWFRRIVRMILVAEFKKHTVMHVRTTFSSSFQTSAQPPLNPDIIDAEFERHPDSPEPPPQRLE